MGDRGARVRSTMSDTFWILVLSIVVLFAFFIALGAFSPGEVTWLTLAVLGARAAVGGARRLGRAPPRPGATRRPSATASGGASEHRPALDPEVAKVLEGMLAMAGPPAHEVPVEQARAGHEAETEHLSGPGEPVAEVRDLEIPVPSCTIPARLYRPEGDGPLPLVAYLHGGGWTIGSIDSFDTVVRALTNASGAIVVERRLPARARGAVPRRAGGLPVRGALAGGERGRARRGPRAAGDRRRQRGRQPRDGRRPAAARRGRRCALQALIYPVTDAGCNTASYRDFGEGHGLTAASMQRFWNLYLDGADGIASRRVAAARRGPGGLAARVRADGRVRPAARRGRGLLRGAARRGRGRRVPPLRRRDPRLLAVAGGDGALPARGRRGGGRPARAARLSGPARPGTLDDPGSPPGGTVPGMAATPTTATSRFWHPFADMGAVSQRELLIERGEGVWVYDAEDRRYLDGTASLWYANIGHGNREVAERVAEQMGRLEAYSTFGDFGNRPANELSERLAVARADGRRADLPRPPAAATRSTRRPRSPAAT